MKIIRPVLTWFLLSFAFFAPAQGQVPKQLKPGDTFTFTGSFKYSPATPTTMANPLTLTFVVKNQSTAFGYRNGFIFNASYTYEPATDGSKATFKFAFQESSQTSLYQEEGTLQLTATTATAGVYDHTGSNYIYTSTPAAGYDFSGTGIYSFTVVGNAAPANDHFADAITVTSTHTAYTSSTFTATRETGETLLGELSADINWENGAIFYEGDPVTAYTYTKRTAKTAVITFTSTSTNAAKTYTSTTDYTIDLTYDGYQSGNALLRANYTEKIGTAAATSGTFLGKASFTQSYPSSYTQAGDFAPANVPAGSSLSLTGALADDLLAQAGQTVWYRWVAPLTGKVTVDTIGSTFDTILAALTGDRLSDLVMIGINDETDFKFPNNTPYYPYTHTSRVFIDVNAGQTYWFVIDGYKYLGKADVGNTTLGLFYTNPNHFPAEAYLNRNLDLKAAYGGKLNSASFAWEHYLTYGVLEGRDDGNGFSPTAYADRYPDIKAAFGSDLRALATHWYVYGRFEGRMVPASFDSAKYFQRNPDLLGTLMTNDLFGAWYHYRTVGAKEGRDYSNDFQALHYLTLNPDLAKAYGADNVAAAHEHWEKNGIKEGRFGRVPATFAAQVYLNRYSDLAAAFGNNAALPRTAVAAFNHFIDAGAKEGRSFDEAFRPQEYLILHEDIKAAYGQDLSGAALHWLRYGKTENRLGRVPTTFPTQAYINNYTDLGNVFGRDATQTATKVAAYRHFITQGVKEGRNPGSSFNATSYLNRYSDLRAAFGNDLSKAAEHWFRFGQTEGRSGN